MKKGRNLIIALAVLAVLAVVYFFARQGLFEEKEEAAESVYVADIDAEDIQEISFTLGEESVTFTKSDDAWKLGSDENFPVDGETLEKLLEEIADLTAVRTLEDTEDEAEYGLDSPVNTITFKDADGNETTLKIGSEASTGDIYLSNSAKENVVYTVSSSFESEFDKDVYDFAAGEDFPSILTDNIEKLTVESAGDTYVFYQEEREVEETKEEDADSEDADDTEAAEDTEDSEDTGTEEEGSEPETEMVWVLQKNQETPVDADSTKVGTLKSSLAGLLYADYVNYNCTDMSEYGLAEPAAKITVEYKDDAKDEETQTVVLYVGSTDENGNYYTTTEGSTEIHTVASGTLEDFLSIQTDDYKAAEEETEAEETAEES